MDNSNSMTHMNDIIQTAAATINNLDPYFDFSTKYPPNHVKNILGHIDISTNVQEIEKDRVRIEISDFNINTMVEKGIMPKHSIA